VTSTSTTTAGVTKPTNTSRRVRVHDRRAGRAAGQGSARSVVTSIRSTGGGAQPLATARWGGRWRGINVVRLLSGERRAPIKAHRMWPFKPHGCARITLKKLQHLGEISDFKIRLGYIGAARTTITIDPRDRQTGGLRALYVVHVAIADVQDFTRLNT